MDSSVNWQKDRVGAAERGENPMVIAEMPSGYAAMGDTQFLPGYCVLLASPQAAQLNDLDMEARTLFLRDMALVGEAIQRVCLPIRVNYSIYGNTDTFLHAHIFPRYEWEEAERRKMPPWLYPRDRWTETQYQYQSDAHDELRAQLTTELERLLCLLPR